MREEIGQPAWNYFRDARLETAAHLLRETEMSIAEIGRLVGYSSTPSFRRLLRTFLGMPASRYRARARRRLARAGPLPTGAQTNQYWERMLDGELSGEEARALDAYLGRLAPASAAAAGEDEERWTRLRRTFAEGLLETLDPTEKPQYMVARDGRWQGGPPASAESFRLPFADQRRLVRDAAWFPDGTLFEILSRRSALSAPDRGVELAILAVDYLATSRIPEVDPRLLPLAWARLARARWRAGDLPGARLDLDRSAQGAAEGDALPAPWEAERSRIAAAFDWLQGRRRQALELADHSVAEHRAAGAPAAGAPELAAALVLRAELQAAAADLEPEAAGARGVELREALTDLQEAQDLAAGAPATGAPAAEAPAGRSGISLLIRLLASIGSRTEIAAALPAVRRAAGELGAGLAPRLKWLEGHTSGSATEIAEAAWREARARFAELGDELWVARTTLDLARLCLAGERPGEAAALASELASTLEAAGGGGRDSAALELPAPFDQVRAGDLDRAENALKRLEWQRRAQRALDLAR